MARGSTPEELGTALRSARERVGLTQEQVAQRLGVATRTVARWESGTTPPKPAVLAALGIGVGQLVGGFLGGGVVVGAAVGAAASFIGMNEGIDLRRERQLAGLNAVVKSLAEKNGFPPHAFARAAAALIAEMVEAGVSLEDLIVLLTSVESSPPPPLNKGRRSQKIVK